MDKYILYASSFDVFEDNQGLLITAVWGRHKGLPHVAPIAVVVEWGELLGQNQRTVKVWRVTLGCSLCHRGFMATSSARLTDAHSYELSTGSAIISNSFLPCHMLLPKQLAQVSLISQR